MVDSAPASVIANADHRGVLRLFGIRQSDRRYHLYLIGKTGVGKSTLLRTLVAQDLGFGNGLALFDPHGDLVESILPLIPERRTSELIHLNIAESGRFHFNPLSGIARESHPLAVSGLVETFKKMWSDGWGPRLEHVLRNAFFTLLETPGANLADLPRLLTDERYRAGLTPQLQNAQVRAFWTDEYATFSPSMRAVVSAPILNKVGAFLSDPLLFQILCGGETTLDLRRIMDTRGILLINLAKGQLGEGPASLLGSLLVSHISLAGLARADTPEASRRDFYLYLDEFHFFATLTLSTMLSELRKYRLNLILAHQYFGQLAGDIRDAVLGNVGTIIAFRVGAKDAPLLAREFVPKFNAEDLVNLPNYHIYLRLMVDSEVSKPFSAQTIEGLEQIPHLFDRLGVSSGRATHPEPGWVDAV